MSLMKYLLILFIFIFIGCSSQKNIPDPITSANIAIDINNLEKYWIIDQAAKPTLPHQPKNISIYSCVNVAFVIGEDGLAHNPNVVKTLPNTSAMFKNAAIKAIKQFKFLPSDLNPSRERVITNYIFSFYIPLANHSLKQINEEFEKLTLKCQLSTKVSSANL